MNLGLKWCMGLRIMAAAAAPGGIPRPMIIIMRGSIPPYICCRKSHTLTKDEQELTEGTAASNTLVILMNTPKTKFTMNIKTKI